MKLKLSDIAREIREIIYNKQKELCLTFEEENHIYTMCDLMGIKRSDWPSVSKVLKHFYEEFPADRIAEQKSLGDPFEKERLLKEWEQTGIYASNMGSRTHYILEKKAIKKFNLNKEIRQPIYECDVEQMAKSDSMVIAGTKYLNLMEERGGTLIDTEMVLGHPILGYTGQPDKMWLMYNKDKSGYGLVITDWKTNKEKNFEVQRWTKQMYKPFSKYPNTALGHYYVQLPLYVKLFLKMLEGSKFENLSFYGGVVVLLKDDSTFAEYKIPTDVISTVISMDMKKYLTIQ